MQILTLLLIHRVASFGLTSRDSRFSFGRNAGGETEPQYSEDLLLVSRIALLHKKDYFVRLAVNISWNTEFAKTGIVVAEVQFRRRKMFRSDFYVYFRKGLANNQDVTSDLRFFFFKEIGLTPNTSAIDAINRITAFLPEHNVKRATREIQLTKMVHV